MQVRGIKYINLVPKMKNAVKRKNVSEHCEDPRNGVQVGDEADPVQMVEEGRVVEGLDVRELGQVLLDDSGVVFAEHTVQISKKMFKLTMFKIALIVLFVFG